MRLANKVAIITGSSSGIGRSTAYLFAKMGAKIVVVANINVSGAEETVDTIKANGGEAIFIQTDVSVASEVEHLIEEAMKRFGKIEILVNNAGTWGPAEEIPIEDTNESAWDHIYAVNVKSIFFTTKYLVPHMRKAGGGVIVNVSSLAGVKPGGVRNAAYMSSKGAAISLTKALAIELAPYNIRVNCVNPILTDTPMLKLMPKEAIIALKSIIPLRRIAKPEDIAYAILYLASDESSMLTGMGINVDGGFGI